MLKFSANISTLFTEVPLLDRIALASQAGFDAVEIQFPYSESATAIRKTLDAVGLPLVLFNCPAGNFMKGGAGSAATPGGEDEFLKAIETAHHYAEVLKPENVNVLSGRLAAGLRRDECLTVLAANLNIAVDIFHDLPTNIITEAINTNDVPGFLLCCSQDVLELMQNVNGLGMQFDLYHMAQMELDLATAIQEYFPCIAHIQFADYPGRHEPGTGGLKFTELFNLIDGLGYSGFIGAEYFPLKDTSSGLHWLRDSSV